jgi:hypothetical protein
MIGAVSGLFYRLPRNVIATFSGRNLLWHTAAIALTIVIVTSGGDWAYYRWTRAGTFFVLARPALGLGMLMPVLWPLALLVSGLALKNCRCRLPLTGGNSTMKPSIPLFFVFVVFSCIILSVAMTDYA